MGSNIKHRGSIVCVRTDKNSNNKYVHGQKNTTPLILYYTIIPDNKNTTPLILSQLVSWLATVRVRVRL